MSSVSRALVVRPARPVGRPDLDEAATRLGHDLRDAEAATDLDELTARDHDLTITRERTQREQHGGGVVVDDDARLGPDGAGEQRAGVLVAGPASSGVHSQLEVRRAPPDRVDRGPGLGTDGRAAQVRVQQDPGGIDHRAEEPVALLGDGGSRRGHDARLVGAATAVDHLPGCVDRVARGDGQELVGESLERLDDTFHGGKGTSGIHRGPSVRAGPVPRSGPARFVRTPVARTRAVVGWWGMTLRSGPRRC